MVGNVLGSNITNILLVLGIAGLIGNETHLKRDLLHIDMPMAPGSAILLGFLIVDGSFNRMDAVLCITGAVIYVYSTIATDVDSDDGPHENERIGARAWLRLLGSLGLILLSAKYTVDAVVVLSAAFGIGTEVIALALSRSAPRYRRS